MHGGWPGDVGLRPRREAGGPPLFGTSVSQQRFLIFGVWVSAELIPTLFFLIWGVGLVYLLRPSQAACWGLGALGAWSPARLPREHPFLRVEALLIFVWKHQLEYSECSSGTFPVLLTFSVHTYTPTS